MNFKAFETQLDVKTGREKQKQTVKITGQATGYNSGTHWATTGSDMLDRRCVFAEKFEKNW